MADNKSFFDRWMDKKVENVVDTSTDFLSRKFMVYLTAFYLVAMLIYVSYSIICLNDIGKLSSCLMIVFGVAFYVAFAVMAAISVWSILKAEGNYSALNELSKMYIAAKIMRRVLGLVTYVITVITLFQTWELGLHYRLFSIIILIAFTAGNLWVVVSDIFRKRLQKRREEEIQKALDAEIAKRNASMINKMKESAKEAVASAGKISFSVVEAIKAKENGGKLKAKLKNLKGGKSQAEEEILEDTDVVEIKSDEIEW